jgi:hypothetical protein
VNVISAARKSPAAEHTRTQAPFRYQPLVCSRVSFYHTIVQRARPGSHTLRVLRGSSLNNPYEHDG